jgi:hypothetical protein
MNKRKLNRVFDEVKIKANLDYAITDTDEYGDCNTCVNSELADVFGIDSKGIYAKHWLKGMNASGAWKNLDHVYIGHDLTEEQGKILIDVFKENGYIITPEEYDPYKSFNIKEV